MNYIPSVWLAFIAGVMAGAAVGVFVLGLCIMQTRNDAEGEIMASKQDREAIDG